MPVNPVQIISSAKARLARLAAVRTLVYILAPAATALLLAVFLPAIGTLTWNRLGYQLDPSVAELTRLALLAAGLAQLLGGAIAGWRSYRRADDFIAAAERLDLRLGTHEQIVTLATLAGPDTPESVKEHRSPLFPLLWRNVMNAVTGVDPRREFRLDVRQPLKRSSLYAAAIAIVLGLAMLALVEPPTPLQQVATRLRQIASKIEHNASSPEQLALATAVSKTANDLTNPKLPPKEKLKRLAALQKQLEHQEQKPKAGEKKTQAAEGASSAGKSSANASGSGKGKGKGAGKGENGSGKGTGKGKSGQGKTGKGEKKNTVELQNQISKAEALVQTGEQSQTKSGAKPSPEKKNGHALVPGNKSQMKGGGKKTGQGEIPQPGKSGEMNAPLPSGTGEKTPKQGKSAGNTHLGEFPAPAKYQRFYKPGQKGPALNIKDARYLMFRIPAAPPSGGGGKTVIDTKRPKATTPYTNAPLGPTRENLPPEQQQLVPPRYRDLIR